MSFQKLKTILKIIIIFIMSLYIYIEYFKDSYYYKDFNLSV